MELYDIILKPCSGFGTPLKGDTLFGHFCWQAFHESSLLKKGLEKHIAGYAKIPFAIFSSAYPRNSDEKAPYFFKRPDISLSYFMESESMDKMRRIQEKKKLKKKNWLNVKTDLFLNLSRDKLFSDDELIQKLTIKETRTDIQKSVSSLVRSHNSINRLNGTTGTGMFTPFETDVSYYHPDSLLSVLVLLNSDATGIEQIVKGLTQIGKWGFGKDAATGMGRFDVQGAVPLPLPDYSNADALYTLAPCVPEKNTFREKYFTPFVRFGKHGDMLARGKNPFKNPVIMADEGAVLIPENKTYDRPYVGLAVSHVSKAMPETIVQGYAPVLPINLGGEK